MNLLHGDARFADVLEQVMYNGLLSGVSLDGDKFFYINPLASRGARKFEAGGGTESWIPESGHHRRHWFKCSCCPPNMLRFLPKIGEYIYAQSHEELYVNLYVESRATMSLKRTQVTLMQETKYPWEGDVKLVVGSEKATEFVINIRIPTWCEHAQLEVNGQAIKNPDIQKGYVRISRRWKQGDRIELRLSMSTQRIQAHPRVKADLGRIALRRGPIVYCLEAVDNGGQVHNLSLPRHAELTCEYRPDLLGGVTVIKGTALARVAEDWHGKLYRPAKKPAEFKPVEFVAVPYCIWDNREPGEMALWLPEPPALTEIGE